MPYVDEVCMGCGGVGKKICTACKGSGKCKYCERGQINDPHCRGTGEDAGRCPDCQGTKQRNDGTPCYNVAAHRCGHCRNGKIDCSMCNGTGKCHNCLGSGRVSCDDCGERGTIAVWQDPPAEEYTA